VGMAAIVAYSLEHGGGRIVGDDWLLLIAVAIVAVGYAEGGLLARTLGGWRTIGWALVSSLPVLLAALLVHEWRHGFPDLRPHTGASWIGFAYVATISMFLGFFAWYRGLGKGGVARVGQLQLLQAPLAFIWSALMLGEPITKEMLGVVGIVIACLAISQKARPVTPSGSEAAAPS